MQDVTTGQHDVTCAGMFTGSAGPKVGLSEEIVPRGVVLVLTGAVVLHAGPAS